MASDLVNDSAKFAQILRGLGFEEGHALHAVVGNNNLTFALFGGAWMLGGICSSGDVALSSAAIAGQVRSNHIFGRYTKIIVTCHGQRAQPKAVYMAFPTCKWSLVTMAKLRQGLQL